MHQTIIMHQQKDLKAKISVIMPVYNGEKYLQTSIESILSQTFTNFEFLILNDGSTDRTAEILKYYADLDSRIKIFHQPNKGLVESLNRLIDLANTDIIARMDVDDIAYPKRFEKV
jgi:glycosyltransferase involved in cell wall biosynthesis